MIFAENFDLFLLSTNLIFQTFETLFFETLWALGTNFDAENRKLSEQDQEDILGIIPPDKEEQNKDWAFFE